MGVFYMRQTEHKWNMGEKECEEDTHKQQQQQQKREIWKRDEKHA